MGVRWNAHSPEVVAEAKRLRAEGLSSRQVGQRLGVSHVTVLKWCDPELAERCRQSTRESERRYRDEYRARKSKAARLRRRAQSGQRCARCDTPSDGILCRRCFEERKAVRVALVHRLWVQGLPVKAIAARLHWSEATISNLVQYGRKNGLEFPSRQRIAA